MKTASPSTKVALALGIAILVLVAALWPAWGQIPQKFTNLKVLPADIPQKALVDQMKGFAFALGTRCWYCHKGEGDDLSTYDFASDEKEHKETARRHMRMTQEINDEFFKGREGKVTCNTCHRGEAEPVD